MSEMCFRRNKQYLHGAIVMVLLGALGYSVYVYNLVKLDLERSTRNADKYFRQQESLSSQLQVVYEHRARLERSLQKETSDHKNTKLEFAKKQNDFVLNITRSKHEAMNRFNSLETRHNMLQAQNKELETQYNALRQQYTRLSSEHLEVDKQQKRAMQLQKEQSVTEITSLNEEIRTLKQQVVSLREHYKAVSDELEKNKLSRSKALESNKKYQEGIKSLQKELAIYKGKQSHLLEQQSEKLSQAADEYTQEKHENTEQRYTGRPKELHPDSRIEESENKGNSRQQRDIHEGARQHSRRGRQSSIDRTRYKQPTMAVELHAPTESDIRRPPGNDDTGEYEPGKRQQEQRLKYPSMKDGVQPVEVVAPADKVVNKWSDVLKNAGAQQVVHNQPQQVEQQVGAAEDVNTKEKIEEEEREEEGDEGDFAQSKDEKLDGEQNQQTAHQQQVADSLQSRVQNPAYMDKRIGRPVGPAEKRRDEKIDRLQDQESPADDGQRAEQHTWGQQDGQTIKGVGWQGQDWKSYDSQLVGEQEREESDESRQQGGEETGYRGHGGEDGNTQGDIALRHSDRRQRELEEKEQTYGDENPEEKDNEERKEEDQGLSRQSINEQVAELQEEAKKRDAQEKAELRERNIEESKKAGQRGQPVPIPAVQRDKKVDEEVHKPAANNDNGDDSDSDSDQDNEVGADNAAEDDENSDRESDVQQPRVLPLQGQSQQQGDTRRFERALKGVIPEGAQNRQEV